MGSGASKAKTDGKKQGYEAPDDTEKTAQPALVEKLFDILDFVRSKEDANYSKRERAAMEEIAQTMHAEYLKQVEEHLMVQNVKIDKLERRKIPFKIGQRRMRNTGTQTEVILINNEKENRCMDSDSAASDVRSHVSSIAGLGNSRASCTLSLGGMNSLIAASNAENEILRHVNGGKGFKKVDSTRKPPRKGTGVRDNTSDSLSMETSPIGKFSSKSLGDRAGHILSAVVTVNTTIFNTFQCVRKVLEDIALFFTAERCEAWILEDSMVLDHKSEGYRQITSAVKEAPEYTTALQAYTEDESVVFSDTSKKVLSVPIPAGNGNIGALVLTNYECDDKTVLTALGGLIGVVYRVKSLFKKAVFQQKKSNAMQDLANFLCESDMNTNVSAGILNSARELVGAERATLYTVSPERDEFTAHFEHENGETNILQMPINTDIAGYIAATGVGITLADAQNDPRFDHNVDSLTDYTTKNLMGMPIYYEGKVQAIALVSNKSGSAGFDGDDFELLGSFVRFAGVGLRNAKYYREMVKEQATTEMVLDIVKAVSESDIRYIESVSDSVIGGAKSLCRADRCALFLVAEERGELHASLADGSEIVIPLGSGIAGAVGQTGEHVNIKSAYDDNRFNQTVDKQTGYRTESILCYPIHCNGEVIAVAQLINKLDGIGRCVAFNKSDEQLLELFASFAGITIGNARLYKFVVEAGNDALNLFNMTTSNQQTNQEHSKKVNFATQEQAEKLMKITVKTSDLDMLHTRSFPIHDYDGTPDYLMAMTVHLFDSLGLIKKFNVNTSKLYLFLATLRNMYRAIPYHNICHAFDVMQTLSTFLHSPDMKDMITDVDMLCLILIGLLHDVDHMGLNNSFHLKAETPLGILISASGSRSVLEVHHCTISMEMLQEDKTNILDGCAERDRKHIYKVITTCILATDMSRHGEIFDEFASIHPEYEKESFEHRLKLMCVLVVTADVSNAFKPFPIARKWGQKITQEFNSQSEQEKNRNIPQTFVTEPTILTQHSAFCKSQIGFMLAIVRPKLLIMQNFLPGCFTPCLESLV